MLKMICIFTFPMHQGKISGCGHCGLCFVHVSYPGVVIQFFYDTTCIIFFLFLQLNKPATNKTPSILGNELDAYAATIGDPF